MAPRGPGCERLSAACGPALLVYGLHTFGLSHRKAEQSWDAASQAPHGRGLCEARMPPLPAGIG